MSLAAESFAVSDVSATSELVTAFAASFAPEATPFVVTAVRLSC
jgi:hypothetical protein